MGLNLILVLHLATLESVEWGLGGGLGVLSLICACGDDY
jgi:hypothetical protein